jgi:predicted Kef-type K+ transport protein
MDSVWLLIALAFGLVAQQLRLPPLVGFLLAGFVLNAFGEEGGELLELASRYGVYLLLFTIGLKLRLKDLLEPVISGGALSHMAVIVAALTGGFLLLGSAGLAFFAGDGWHTAAIAAFALSFSSTVFAVKIFEERGETRTRHAVISIGILIVQDILAVLFLLFAEQKLPSVWALLLLALPLLQPFLKATLKRAGHGEILVLFGLAITAFGAELFDAVGMKPAIGVLVFGILLGGHEKSVELAKALLSFKDFFLLGFFLSIGLIGLPDLQGLGVMAVLIVFVLPVKIVLFFWLLTRFNIAARTAMLVALSLGCFSEFGLIVANEGYSLGLLGGDWLVLLAVSTAVSFALASVLNARAHELYERFETFLCGFETDKCRDAAVPPEIGDAEVLIAGMGRVGRGAYRTMRDSYHMKVCGIDTDLDKRAMLETKGFDVLRGDAEDVDFWRQVIQSQVRLVLLALPTHQDMLKAAKLLRKQGFSGRIGAVSRYEDDRLELEQAGVDAAYNYYQEVGTGFADHIQREMGGDTVSGN